MLSGVPGRADIFPSRPAIWINISHLLAGFGY
jgi:hypothetical protein